MKNLLLVAILTIFVGSTFAQNSVQQNQNTNSAIQSLGNQQVIYEHGQVIGNVQTNVNNNQALNPHHAKNGNNTLGLYWDTTGCGLNYIHGTRMTTTRYNAYAITTLGTGFPTTIPMAGLPTNAVVVKSVMWMIASYFNNSAPSTPTMIIQNPNGGPDTIVATLAGSSGPKCWGDIGTRTFRFDIPGAISATSGGAIGCDGTYHVNFTNYADAGHDIDGVSLWIIYKDPAATYNGTFSIYDGCDSYMGGNASYNVTNFNVCAAPLISRGFSIVSDMQDNVNSALHPAIFNNTTFNNFPNSFMNGDDTSGIGLVSGQTVCVNGYQNASDCYCVAQTGVYYQTTCTTCTATIGSGISFLHLPADSINTTCNQANGQAWVAPSGGSTPYSYIWSTTPVQTSATATSLAAGYAYVTVTDGSCHSSVDSILIGTSASVTLSFTHTNVLCNGMSTGRIICDTIGGIAPFTYVWSPSGGNTLTANNLAAGIYTITVTDAVGCTKIAMDTITEPLALAVTANPTNVLCFGTSTGIIPLSVTGGTTGYTYVWSPVQGNVATANNLAAGSYNVTITDANGCTITNNTAITEPASLTLSLSPAATICIGQSTTLSTTVGGGTPVYSYSWTNGSNAATQSVNPVVTTSYSATITDANGCTRTAGPVTITVNPPLTVTAASTSQICEGQTATISAYATGGNGAYTYTWNNGVGNGAGPITVQPTVTTVYSVTVTDNCTVPDVTTNDTVVVNPAPTVVFSGFPLSGCVPLEVQFTDQSTSTLPIVKREWVFGDGSAHADSTNPIHIYNISGIYSVTLSVTSSSNCTSTLTDSAMVDAYPVPKARFIVSPTTTSLITPEIDFTDQSVGANYVYYNFGDGSSSTHRNPYHNYTDTGTFWVKQVVINTYGCSDTITAMVTITPDYEFYIPAAFTPNNDGLNDYFGGIGHGITDYEITIFDRWGEKIFYSNDMGLPWDGMNNGAIAMQGVYIYDIKIKDRNQVSHEYFGKITLVR
ncbi:MAG: PKD domain-containing protein [Bacteroidota bacterium]